MEKLKRVKKIYSSFAVCLIIFGIILLIKPTMTAALFCKLCGVVLFVFGIVKLIGYFSRDILQLAFQFDFAMGIISSLIGLGMIIWPNRFMETLTFVIGLFILGDALLRVQTALDAKQIGLNKWWIILVIALVTVVIGTILFLKPHEGTKTIIMLIGLNLIIDGILNLFVVQSTVTTIRRRHKWEN